jgi:hypothetical protein
MVLYVLCDVFVYSRFTENPPIWSWETNTSFLRWFCHTWPSIPLSLRFDTKSAEHPFTNFFSTRNVLPPKQSAPSLVPYQCRLSAPNCWSLPPCAGLSWSAGSVPLLSELYACTLILPNWSTPHLPLVLLELQDIAESPPTTVSLHCRRTSPPRSTSSASSLPHLSGEPQPPRYCPTATPHDAGSRGANLMSPRPLASRHRTAVGAMIIFGSGCTT